MKQPDSSSALGLRASKHGDPTACALVTDPFGLVGAVLDRKYAVDHAVAEGGYGVVYRGHHTSLGVAVAIKLLKLEPGERDTTAADMIAGFIQEAHSVARLRHANIVSVLDAGEHFSAAMGRNVPYIVFEWLDGPTLAVDLAARRGRGGRTLDEAMVLWRPVCEAIAFAHQAGVVHRDLKPKNLILQGTAERPLPKVLDFGIAKPFETMLGPPDSTQTDSGRLAFSPDYAAPEQLSGTRTGPWTDVHALGLLLVELLVDVPPYGDGDPPDRYARAFSPDRPTPRSFGTDLGPVEAVLARALCLKPRGRYANATELLAAMDEAYASHALVGAGKADADRALAQEVPSVARSSRSRRRTMGVAGFGAAAALGVFAGWRFVTMDREPQDATGASASAQGSSDVTGAREPSPVRGTPPEHEMPADGGNLEAAPSPELSAHPPPPRAVTPARLVPPLEVGSTRSSPPAPMVPSTASVPAPVVTTPGVPAPYRLE